MGLSGGDGTRKLTTMNTKTELKSTETHASIKLGIDAHATGRLAGETQLIVQKRSCLNRLNSTLFGIC